MTDWAFWCALAGMLWIGHRCRVGVYMIQFSVSALIAALGSIVFSWSMDRQLHLFLLAASVQTIAAYVAARLKGA